MAYSDQTAETKYYERTSSHYRSNAKRRIHEPKDSFVLPDPYSLCIDGVFSELRSGFSDPKLRAPHPIYRVCPSQSSTNLLSEHGLEDRYVICYRRWLQR